MILACQPNDQVSFAYQIKPLLSDRCFKCHGPDKNQRKADFRLDQKEGLLGKLPESGLYAFVAGDLNESEAWQRIMSDDPEYMMPPPDSHLSLSEDEKNLIAEWIEQGAQFEKHWAFTPIKRPVVPEVSQKELANNQIDHFILQKLDQKGLSASPRAEKEMLIRRVSFDLTGLPPTLEEIDSFLKDQSLKAFESVIDRLLASPHYGERMATEWLDLSRYADSHGYQDDGFRYVWPWRDWVVEAFNQNMPFDQFLTWQLAGDLIPRASQKQKLATTFLRNHRINSEAGIVDEEYRLEYVADRTNTLGSGIMGLTMECARCHDHKYDPISQKEYYQLSAFFNQVNEMGEIANDGNPGPLLPLMDRETEKLINWLDGKIETLRDSIAHQKEKIDMIAPPNQKSLETGLRKELIYHLPLDKLGKSTTPNLAMDRPPAKLKGEIEIHDGYKNGAVLLGTKDNVIIEHGFDRADPFSLSLWVYPVQDDEYVPLMGNQGNKNQDYMGMGLSLNNGKPTVNLCHAMPHNQILIQAVQEVTLNQWTHIAATYEGNSKADGIRIYINGNKAQTTTLFDDLYKTFKRGGMGIGGFNRSKGSFDGGKIDEVRVYTRALSPLEVKFIAENGQTDPQSYTGLWKLHAQAHNSALDSMRSRLSALIQQSQHVFDSIPEIMTIEELDVPRATFVLDRGSYDAPTDKIMANALDWMTPFTAKAQADRLDLAQWLFHPRHPLTARVLVNRYWQMFFGRGLVSSTGDFGNQGELPSHPELLDWLANWLIRSGWDMKGLHKLMLMSATYQQTSVADSLHLQQDPDNQWLSRGPVQRLTAEMLRDQALAVSGLLNRQIGGPPVKPYQPAGIWEEVAAIKNSLSTYQQDHGDKLYRRSLYTIWKRSVPPPSMTIFDAPGRDLCQIKRQQTATPLQALALWNDPQIIEASRILAERSLRETSTQKEDRIQFMFRLLTSRRPDNYEMERLKSLLNKQLTFFQENADEAVNWSSVGESPVDASLYPHELAAYGFIASTIMNMDDAIVKR